eukprot:gene18597-18886_t
MYGAWLNHPDYAPLVDPLYLINIKGLKIPAGETSRLGVGQQIHVFAPATVANVVCGFDVLGFAVNEPGDEVIMRITGKPGITISKITGDDGRL